LERRVHEAENSEMSLCLALLLAVIAIDWWQGWQPFNHPFQMPGKARLTGLFNHSQPAPAIEPQIAEAREPPSTLLGGSHQ
jgi:hypothetical protein